jgi:hypothetical protein
VRCCRYSPSSALSSTLNSSQQIAHPSRNSSITSRTRCHSPHVTPLLLRYPLIRDRQHPLPVKNRAIACTLTSAHLRLAVSSTLVCPTSITDSTVSSSCPSRPLSCVKSVMLYGIPTCSVNTTPRISTPVPNADVAQINPLSSIYCASALGRSGASA